MGGRRSDRPPRPRHPVLAGRAFRPGHTGVKFWTPDHHSVCDQTIFSLRVCDVCRSWRYRVAEYRCKSVAAASQPRPADRRAFGDKYSRRISPYWPFEIFSCRDPILKYNIAVIVVDNIRMALARQGIYTRMRKNMNKSSPVFAFPFIK